MTNIEANPFPSSEERRAMGRARRKQMKRQTHGEWTAKLRRHDPLELMAASMKGRVASLVPLKYERMMASPFGYFRGAVPVMSADLALLPNTGILNQICGDAHVRNLGAYAAPDGRLVFDINDFDETMRAPFEWDLKRLATSLILAAREAGDSERSAHESVLAFLAHYRRCARMFAAMPVLEVARYQVHRLARASLISGVLRKAERATPQHSLAALTVQEKSGARVFREERPVLWRVKGAAARAVLESLREYNESLLPERRHTLSQYHPVDVCFKVVGTGSVGTRDYCVYMEGNGESDPLFLQIKEEPGAAYAPYLEAEQTVLHRGRAVAEGQRAMQMQSDPFLGWTTLDGREYLVRQLNDHKASIEVEDLKGAGLLAYAELCGELLARGHARSGDVQLILGYLGRGQSFAGAVAGFAEAYAAQTERDWQALRKARRVRKAGAVTAK
ncbi:MAG: DUF2252 domain-containing protein [Acidobacteriota bacterium]|nr:DUF2252 domain-containing protein [Acidobacteriota bacterium]